MRVLHVVNISFVLPYFLGDQFDYLQNKGHDVFVACTPSPHFYAYAKEKNFVPIGVEIFRGFSLIKDFKTILSLVKLINAEKIEVVVGHTPKGALLAMVASRIANVKRRVYARHGLLYETAKGLKRILLKRIEKFTGFLATKVICDSNSVLTVSNTEKLSDASKNFIINKGSCNGVDCENLYNRNNVSNSDIQLLKDKYNILTEDSVVGYVGRLVNDKGINELIAGWQILKQNFINIKLLLVGPLEERDGLTMQAQNLIEADPTIIHTGLTDGVNKHYALMDIFILPSYREGFPTVVLEASSMELPVITTEATGCRDSIIDGQTGLFTEIEPTSIAKTIEMYLENRQLAVQHGKNGRAFIEENFNQRTMWPEIENQITTF